MQVPSLAHFHLIPFNKCADPPCDHQDRSAGNEFDWRSRGTIFESQVGASRVLIESPRNFRQYLWPDTLNRPRFFGLHCCF